VIVEALELAIRLLEKVSVLVGTALVMLMARPAEVWLGKTGAEASLRRRLFLIAVLGVLAIWGVFLGFEIDGLRFNVRMVGIIVAGYLGGVWVGPIVGLAAGLVAVFRPVDYPFYVVAASVLNGGLAGLWSRRYGTGLVAAVLGALVIQIGYHLGLGGLLAAIDPDEALHLASYVELHAAKIAANAIGVSVFVGLLKIFRELEWARREVRTSRDLVRSARLEALQYQVQPHFLFNLLNTLAHLIRTDATRARRLTLDLAEFLRYTLSREEDVTNVREELQQIERYVELERARFGDELVFEVGDLPDERAADVAVPPLILQPLVENAIRHGSRDGSVHVRVEVERRDDQLEIRVLDDGPGPPASGAEHESQSVPSPATEPKGRGMGLDNVRERLQRFYRGRSSLELTAREGREGACARCTIPLDPEASDGAGFRAQAREQLKKVVHPSDSPIQP
jgi:LytS/YehU family sensor histidine kinase